jgi:VWFA-related protein
MAAGSSCSRWPVSPFPRAFGRVACLVAITSITLWGNQSDQPTFRAGVQVVEVDVRVFDPEGRFVADLTREDFELIEDGVPQQLQTAYLVDERERSNVTGTGQPTAERRAPAALPVTAQQTWVFVFDVNHLTPGGGFDRARTAVEEFIRDRFKDGDVAGVVAGSRMVNNRLTSVREELVAAVRSVKPLTETRNRQIDLTREWPRLLDEAEALRIANEDSETLNRAISRACTEDPDACRRVLPDMEIREKARRLRREIQRMTMESLTAMNALASGLARMTGPKTIVFLSDGFVVQELETTLQQVVGQTARAGARIYAIDVRGLNRGRGTGIIDQMQVDDPYGAQVQFDLQEDGPNSLAVDTGGWMIRNENNIGRALDTVARDAGRYYVLGYQPTNAVFDGRFRAIKVGVKRPGIRVRARRGYLALEPSRMLVPKPITVTTTNETAPAGTDVGSSVASAASPATTTAEGTVVATPATGTAGMVRLRPGAHARVESLSAREPTGPSEVAQKGWAAYQRGDIEAALPLLAAAAAEPQARPWVLYTLGLSQMALGRAVDAAASWERVRQGAPEFTDVYIDLADTYAQLSDLTKALAVLRDAEARWPTDPEIHNAVGVIHVRRGALDDAIAAFSKAAAAAPGDALAFFNLGRAYEMRYVRGRRYVSSQRRWTASEEDRRKATENYERYVKLGGPYASEAAEAINRLAWTQR